MTKYDSVPAPAHVWKDLTSGVEVLASMTGFDQRKLRFVHVADTIWPIGALVKVGQASPRRYTTMTIADLTDPIELAKFAGVIRQEEVDVDPADPYGYVLIHGMANPDVINCRGTILTTEQIQLLPGKLFQVNGFWRF